VEFNWYLVRVSVRSGVLGVGVVIHVLRLLHERRVVFAVCLLKGLQTWTLRSSESMTQYRRTQHAQNVTTIYL